MFLSVFIYFDMTTLFPSIYYHGDFVFFCTETYLVHWAHRIEDTNTLDFDQYYYLFNSPTVGTQLQQKRVFKRMSKRILERTSKKIPKRMLKRDDI